MFSLNFQKHITQVKLINKNDFLPKIHNKKLESPQKSRCFNKPRVSVKMIISKKTKPTPTDSREFLINYQNIEMKMMMKVIPIPLLASIEPEITHFCFADSSMNTDD